LGLNLKNDTIKVLREALQGSSLEPMCYIVGGSVRDLILGRKVSDYDICVALPQGNQILADYLFSKGFCSHPKKYKKHGLTTCRMNGALLEISQTVKDHKRTGRFAPEIFGNLSEDAFSRDFTVNSLYLRLSDLELLDPTGRGYDDLNNRKLICIKSADLCFKDDPLRMMRAIRFNVDLGFEIAPDMLDFIANHASLLQGVAKDRISDEFKRMMGPSFLLYLQKLINSGLMTALSPTLSRSWEYLAKDLGSAQNIFAIYERVMDYNTIVLFLFWLGLRYQAIEDKQCSCYEDAWKSVTSSLNAIGQILVLSNREKSLLSDLGLVYLYLIAKGLSRVNELPDMQCLAEMFSSHYDQLKQLLRWGRISNWHELGEQELLKQMYDSEDHHSLQAFPYNGNHILPLLKKHDYKYTGLILLLIHLNWLQNNIHNYSDLTEVVNDLVGNPNLSAAWELYRSNPSKAAILWHLSTFKRYHLIIQTESRSRSEEKPDI
jgi:tRNA nucleotidyltransferase/poly(A) polymerase